MAEEMKVWLDRELQIIRHRVKGDQSVEEFREMVHRIEQLCDQLDDPDNVHILADVRQTGPASREVRMEASKVFPDRVKKLAAVGGGPVTRILVKFLMIWFGPARMRMFATEEEALAWLMDGRSGKGHK